MSRTASILAVLIATACGDDASATKASKPEATPPPTKAEAPEPEPEPAAPPEPEPEPPPTPIRTGHVDTTGAVLLQQLYWMPPEYMLGRKPALAVLGTVRELAKMKSRRPSMQGPPRFVFEARVEVDKVLHGTLENEFVIAELADGLKVGEQIVVFAHEHEGKLGLIEAKGSNCKVGIEIAGPTDPILAVLPATLDGTADLSDPAIADAWRPYGEPAIQCWLDHKPVADCE